MSRCLRTAVLGALGLVLAASCATAPKPVVEWPPPPDTARIRYVGSFSSSDDLDQSTSSQVFRTLMGGGSPLRLGRPMGLAVSNDGNKLYIADTGTGLLLVADFPAKTLKEFAPPNVVGMPFAVAVDAADNVYVTDTGGRRVVVLKPDGTFLRAFGTEAELVRPAGIAVDSRNGLVYVADPARVDSEEHRVIAFDLEGNVVRVLGGPRGKEPGQFNFPIFLAVDDRGTLIVGDTLNFRLQLFDVEGQFLRAYGENAMTPGSFSRLKGIAIDGFGNIYTVESEDAAVQIFNSDLQILMTFGGNMRLLEYPSLPVPIAIDRKRNRIYLGNQTNPRINVYDLVNTSAADTAREKPR